MFKLRTSRIVGCVVDLQETYMYAKTLLDCATANADGRARALVVGGGIANFTDVAATFRGIIQVGASAAFRSVCKLALRNPKVSPCCL